MMKILYQSITIAMLVLCLIGAVGAIVVLFMSFADYDKQGWMWFRMFWPAITASGILGVLYKVSRYIDERTALPDDDPAEMDY